MHLMQLFNRPWLHRCLPFSLTAVATCFAVGGLTPAALAQKGGTVSPEVRKFLLEHSILPNGRIVPRIKHSPMVPTRVTKARLDAPTRTIAWRNFMKRYPFNTPDAQAYVRAMVQRDNMPAATIRGAGPALVPTATSLQATGRVNISTSQNRWNFIGPTLLIPPDGNSTYGSDFIAGRVNHAAMDAKGNVYVATAGGGVWRFRPNPTFNPTNPSDPANPRLLVTGLNVANPSPQPLTDFAFPALQTSFVAIDPRNDSAVYVGLGDYNLAGRDLLPGEGTFPSRQSNNVGYSLGMMKSVNAGKTWANIGNSTLVPVRAYAVAPSNPLATTTVFVGNDADLSSCDDYYVPYRIRFTSGPAAGQTAQVTAYNGQTKTFTLGAGLTQAPLTGNQFVFVDATWMEGTAVSGIIVDPDNSQRIVATAGRGINRGGVWYSKDGGNTFVRPCLVTNGRMVGMPFGDWSSVDVSLKDTNGNRVYYATRTGDGVYRSFDRGETWAKMDVPLVFNDPNVGGSAGASQLGLKVAASKKAGQANIVYVFDASGGNNDGRVFKSINGNIGSAAKDLTTQPSWIDITGNFFRSESVNNFLFADYDTTLVAGIAPVSLTDKNGNITGPNQLSQEVLYGGQQFMSIGLGAVKVGNSLFGSSADGTPILRDDIGVGQDWTEVVFEPGNPPVVNTHLFQHGVFQDPRNQIAFVSNDGGLFPLFIDSGKLTPPDPGSIFPAFFGNSQVSFLSVTPALQPNAVFPITEVYRADFIQTAAGPTSNPFLNKVRVAGSTISNGVFLGELDFSASTTDWSPLQYIDPAGIADVAARTGIQQIIKDYPVDGDDSLRDPRAFYPLNPPLDDPARFTYERFDTSGTSLNDPDGIGRIGADDPGLNYNIDIDNIIFDPNDPTGNTQYMITAGDPGTPWGDPNFTGNTFKRVFFTTNNWNNYQDITPNRYVGSFNGSGFTPFFTTARNPIIYFGNAFEPADTTTPTNWDGETRPFIGMPMAIGLAHAITSRFGNRFFPNNATTNIPPFNAQGQIGDQLPSQPCMYTGGTFLWRFDPPGSRAKPFLPPGPLAKTANPTMGAPYTYLERAYPNKDRGVWRRVSPQLAANGAFITAIAILPGGSNADRIYVGTSAGDVWITTNGTRLTPASVVNDFVATTGASWRHIAGPGVAGSTLPQRPVTAISINSDPSATNLGDIVVSLGGATGVRRVWRSTNTTGTNVPVFTPASGQGFASLPDVPVNDIVRDPDDPTNTLFAATDVGVFTTIDGGATWSNATVPLNLPNVECTSIKVIPATIPTSSTRSPRQLYVSTFGRGIWRFDLNDLVASNAKPDLSFSQTFTRNGAEIIATVTILNSKNPSSSGTAVGTAFNVRLTAASIKNGTLVTNTTSLGSGSINVGTIAPGQSQTVTVRFPSTAGRAGQAVFFNVGVAYTLPPFPPGTPATKDNSPGYRTRLP